MIKIIGLAGTFASGKDTLAHYLVENYNYLHISTGDMIRQEALKLRRSIERPVLKEVGNELRRTRGAGVLVEIAIENFNKYIEAGETYRGVVISGLRTIGEVKQLKVAGGVLLFTDAPIEVRYQRMISRQRDAETKLTFEAFQAEEEKELQSKGNNEVAQSIMSMRELADVIIINDADLDRFLAKARQAISS